MSTMSDLSYRPNVNGNMNAEWKWLKGYSLNANDFNVGVPRRGQRTGGDQLLVHVLHLLSIFARFSSHSVANDAISTLPTPGRCSNMLVISPIQTTCPSVT